MDRVERVLRSSKVVNRKGYFYFVSPITDGIPRVEKEILEEIADKIAAYIENADKIVTIEAMGLPIATVLTIKTGIPFVVVRKRRYEIDGEIEVEQRTGYGGGKLYINGIEKGDKVVVVDDVVSTGGTLLSVLNALRRIAEIEKVVVVVERGDGKKRIEQEGYNMVALYKVEVSEDGVHVIATTDSRNSER